MIVRLNKYLAQCGVASRRKSDALIEEGRVSVNGNVVLELGVKVDPDKDDIFIDGQKLKPQGKVYFLLNKPKGIISTTSDDKKRVTVVQLINTSQKIFPVGRLDFNTTGVLLLTNDGELSNYLTHPKNGIEREYEVKLDKELKKNDRENLVKGIFLDKKRSKFVDVSFPKANNYYFVKVVTVEGRNHFVKNMFYALGYTVNGLHRSRYGKVVLSNLQKGEYRKLSEREVKAISKK
ncbi:MAG: pseudouridine synthase [Melioribacteraceae bacterium]